jgi:hypothetical protein
VNFSAKKIGNTISAMLVGGTLGNMLQDFKLFNSYLLFVFGIIFSITFDWSKSLEEKHSSLEHLKLDKKILKEQLKNKAIQQELRKLNEGK